MLEETGLPVKILTDHKNLTYFMSTKQFFRRQVRWSEFLSRFNFVIQYRFGKLGAKPDALTRKSEIFFLKKNDRFQQMIQTILKSHNLNPEMQKNLVAVFLHMKKAENEKIPSLKKLIDRGYRNFFCQIMF